MEDLAIHGFSGLILISQTPSTCLYLGSHPSCPSCSPQIAIKLHFFPSLLLSNAAHKQLSETQQLRSHPSALRICECFEFNTSDGRFCLAVVTEWRGLNVLREMRRGRIWEERELRDIARDVVSVLAYAERLNFAHRNVKPQNIFYNFATHQAKLGDFCSALELESSVTSTDLSGSPAYMSPEVKEGLRSSQSSVLHHVIKSDVYSLGITLLVLSTRELLPFSTEPASKLTPLQYSPQFKSIISDMIQTNPQLRPTFHQIEQKYFQKTANFDYFTKDLNEKHCNFLCCSRTSPSVIPILLCCPNSVPLNFCGMQCFARFIEKFTENFTKTDVNCPICGAVIREETIIDAFGGPKNMQKYKLKSYRNGLICVSCRENDATHTIECGHLYCETCLEMYKTSIFKKREYICAVCQEIFHKKAKKFKEKTKNLGCFRVS